MQPMEQLLEIMRRLRDPQTGCPWDREQTFETIVPHTLEEAYEVADAIERGDLDELGEELGDLLFQVVFYAQLAAERDAFDFADVAAGIGEKLIRRHPHVFREEAIDSS
ncbi:MAG: MazG nucleotide pyrophosphohydrolase domain-containing protein, partial [Gammaproteobacteria bacterium]